MKVCCLAVILLFTSGLGVCHSAKVDGNDEKIIIVTKTENRKYNLTAIFYGVDFHFEDEKNTNTKIIKYVVFRHNTTGEEVKYKPTGQISAGDFYFTDIWSPDEEYIVLPIGTFQGFAIFEAKDALNNIKANKYFDTIKTKSTNSGFYYHQFEKWEDSSTFSFRAGLDGKMFAFKYNAAKKELYCYQEKCEEFEIGFNNKGKIKAAKKGDITPTEIH